MAEDFIVALTEYRHGVPMGFYTDCDTAVCRDDAPAGFMAGDYSEWPGFDGWESPAAIFLDSESDSVTHCATCGRVIAHDLTAEGMASITESLERHLAGDTGAAIAQWMEAYGDDVDLPDGYITAFRQGYAHAMIWANTRVEPDPEGTGQSGDTNPADWQNPGDPEWAVSAFAPEDQDSIRGDCADFVRANWLDLGTVASKEDAGQAGHDFALTRNRHGAGFWDRGLGDAGDRLSEAARAYGESTAWVSADDLDNGSAVVHLD